jgi:hypothetical protein
MRMLLVRRRRKASARITNKIGALPSAIDRGLRGDHPEPPFMGPIQLPLIRRGQVSADWLHILAIGCMFWLCLLGETGRCLSLSQLPMTFTAAAFV